VEGVHLSRLRTDTPTIHQIELNKKGGEQLKSTGGRCACHVSGKKSKNNNPKPQKKKQQDKQNSKGKATGVSAKVSEEYKCTCHVYGQTHKYRKTTKTEKEEAKQATNKARREKVQVHLSRLWTDTPVRRKRTGE